MPVIDVEALINNRVAALLNYHQSCGVERAQLDVSGGIDSACMLGLLVKALGPQNVTAVYTGIHSSEDSRAQAREVAKAFAVSLIDFDATSIFEQLHTTMVEALVGSGVDEGELQGRLLAQPTILGSIRSCLRAPIGRGFNRMTGGGIRHGTGNECEDRWLRFYQKGGDGEVDSNPIDMLSKGEVFQLARALGVPNSILTAKPTPDLWAAGQQHNDEDEIAAYLKVSFGKHTWYTYTDDLGQYDGVGLSERISRFLDSPYEDGLVEHLLFADEVEDSAMEGLISAAFQSSLFKGVEESLIRQLLTVVRHVEAITRHKYNANCPSLGDRSSLLEAGILTDVLPVG